MGIITKEKSNFPTLLRNAINCSAIENASNTEDYILTDYLLACLSAYETAVIRRDKNRNKDKSQDKISSKQLEKEADEYFNKKQKTPKKITTSSSGSLGIE